MDEISVIREFFSSAEGSFAFLQGSEPRMIRIKPAMTVAVNTSDENAVRKMCFSLAL
jgi:hypothetical protein